MNAKIVVDFEKDRGKLRRLNGGNLGPALHPDNPRLWQEFSALELPLARLHDAPLMNPGMRLVDIQHIFGNWEADADDPKNYYFDQTDEYLLRFVKTGTPLMYRLGTSIEHCDPHFYAFPPRDFQKWSRICTNIIRHYNCGWKNGFHHKIQYWEIWNEPDDSRCFAPNPSKMWNGTADQYCRLYETAVKAIKQEFPDLKVGGGSFWKINPTTGPGENDFLEKFLTHCRDSRAPLDFFSWHSYASPGNPWGLVREPQKARELLDQYGFPNTELHLNEWRYLENWDKKHNMLQKKNHAGSAKSAVHAAAVVTLWQDTPLDMGNFYTLGSGMSSWGAWYAWGECSKTYFAFLAMAQMMHYDCRKEASSEDPLVFVLAGSSSAGKRAILISDFCSQCSRIDVQTGPGSFQVYRLDEEHNLTAVSAEEGNGGLTLPVAPGEAVMFLIKEK